MPGSRKISVARLEVYRLAADGTPAKIITQALGKSPGTVSEHIAYLEREGYLFLASGKDQVKIYEKGPKAKVLDSISSEKSHVGRDPTHVKLRTSDDNSELVGHNSELVEKPPNYRELPIPPSCDVHSHGVRAKVLKTGDIEEIAENGDDPRPFMVHRPLNNGVDQWFGTVKVNGQKFSIKCMDSPEAGTWLYVWVEGTFTQEEMEAGGIEERLMCSAQDVFNHVSKYAGWKFGIMEAHKGSKTHYVPNSSLVDALAKELPPEILETVEDIHYDDTPPREDGQPTPETTDPLTASALMVNVKDMAREYKDMKVAVQVMVQDRHILFQTVNQAMVNQEALIAILKSLGIAAPGPPGTGEEVG